MQLPSRPAEVSWFRGVTPGLLLVVALAAGARVVAPSLPGSTSEITVGVVLGIGIATLVAIPGMFSPGIRFAVHRLLRLGIVLLGARLSLEVVLQLGASAILLVLACVIFAFAFTMLLARAAGIPPRLATLIAVGTAICGNSAIVATAPVIRAEDREVSFAIATITIFGVAAVLLYPAIGSALGMENGVFGHWAGLAINDTSQVTAAGFAYSTAAGETATIVKLTRNLMIGPALIVVGVLYAGGPAAATDRGKPAPGPHSLLKYVPLFVLGFVAMAALNSLGLIPEEIGEGFGEASRALILIALCGVGLGTDFRSMGRIGFKPFVVGLAGALGLSLLGLTLATLLVG